MPRTPQEQMAMTPAVYDFTRKFGRGQQRQEEPSVIQQIAGTLGNVALAGAGIAGAYGLARALGPETPSKGQIGTLNSATIDLNPDYSPPTVDSGPEFDVQGDISSPEQQSDFYITEEQANAMSPSEVSEAYSNLSNATSDPNLKEIYKRSADRNTSRIEQPTDEIVVVDDPQPAITTTQQDPKSFLGDFAKGAISKAQEEVDAFDAGVDWGDTLDQAASAGSPVEGALILGGSVAKKGFHDTKTRIGKDINTAGNIVSEAVANVQKIPTAMQEVDSVIANEQMKASVMPDNKM